MNTYDRTFSKKINNLVERGTNAVKVEPEGNLLDVVRFKVLLLE